MTCAAQIENCIKLQTQQQQQQQQHAVAEFKKFNNSGKFSKTKSCKLLSAPRAARAQQQQLEQAKAQLSKAAAAASGTNSTSNSSQQNVYPSSPTNMYMNRTTSSSSSSSSATTSNCIISNNSNSCNMLRVAANDVEMPMNALQQNYEEPQPVLQPNASHVQQQQQECSVKAAQEQQFNSLRRHHSTSNNFKFGYSLSGGRRRSFADLLCFCYVQLFGVLLLLISDHLPSVSASTSLLSKHEPMFISRSETFKFVAGDTIVLPCEVANTDPYVVAWKRGIAILTAGSVKVTPDPRVRLVNGFNLQIRDAVPQDAGDYICQIATMEPREITHTVEILVPPRIHHISTGGHLQVKKGSSVRIECSASGNPTPNVTWSRKNNILPNGEEKLHSHILSIENVDRHKGGVYICTANNGVGQPASSQVVLHVLYPPEISVERPVVFSGEGHEAMLVCIVHGETQPEVIWFKDTMQLDTTERHIMENRGSRHTLIIRKVHPQDFGNYSCVAENQLGKSRKTLQLSGKPNVAVFNSPPISQYKDRYNISWTVDSHTPIEEYKLSFRRSPQGHEVDNSIDTHSSGVHGSSSSSLLQMYGGGGGGGGGLLGSNHNHRINGGLGGMGGGGGGLGSYGNVMHWGRNDWRDVVLPAIPLSHHYTQGMSYMIRGLDPDQQYEATVQARNRYGWSDLTHSFIFSTSSNDNEMRELSVTFYNSVAASKPKLSHLALLGMTLVLVKLKLMLA